MIGVLNAPAERGVQVVALLLNALEPDRLVRPAELGFELLDQPQHPVAMAFGEPETEVGGGQVLRRIVPQGLQQSIPPLSIEPWLGHHQRLVDQTSEEPDDVEFCAAISSTGRLGALAPKSAG